MVRDLRDRCPWDRAQTRERCAPTWSRRCSSWTRRWARATPPAIRDELSDLLLHLAFQLVIAEERASSRPTTSRRARGKMRRRHPHLFDLGDAEPWERIKRRGAARAHARRHLPTLPPLLKAYRLQERAASVGFDWPDAAGPGKVREELAEVEAELARPPARSAGRSRPTRTPPRRAERRAGRRDRRPAVRRRQPGAEGRRAAGRRRWTGPTGNSGDGSRRSSGWPRRAGSSSRRRAGALDRLWDESEGGEGAGGARSRGTAGGSAGERRSPPGCAGRPRSRPRSARRRGRSPSARRSRTSGGRGTSGRPRDPAPALDPGQQPVVVVLALRAADDLAVAFRRQAVVVEHGPGIVGVLLHVERLHLLG